jgi:hypothetical protein
MIKNLPNAEYHNHPAIGSSGLKLLQRSPLHYWAKYLDPDREREEPTPAMKLGTAWHCAIFEPDQFTERYVQVPEGLDRRTKEGKALWAELEASGLEPLSASTWEQLRRMREASRSNPISRVLFGDGVSAVCEASMFWVDSDTGANCKMRPDFMVAPCEMFPHGLIADGKTCLDASPEGFAKFVWNYDAHLQSAWYCDGFQKVHGTSQPPTFIWLAQEKDAPFASAYYSASEDLLAYGRKTYKSLLEIYKNCVASNTWPGYPSEVKPLTLPTWAEKQVSEAIDN